jgi:hypothetical protein
MANARYLDMDSLKEDRFYVLEFDLPEARGGHGRTVGLHKLGALWVDDGDRCPPAAADSIYRAVREIELWAA